MKLYFTLLLLCTLFTQTGFSSAIAGEKASTNKLHYNTNDCSITIFGNSLKYPKSFLKDGYPQGILIDMLSYIGKEMGCHFNIELSPWNKSYSKMVKGYGGIMGLSMNSKRLKILDYSNIMFYDELRVLVRKGKEFDFKSIEDLKGKKVLATRGVSFGDKWDQYIKEKHIELVEDGGIISKRIELLLKHRADAAIIGPGMAAVNKAIKGHPFLKLNRNQIIVLKTPLKRDPNYLGFSKKINKKKFLKVFNQYIKKGYDNGVFQLIIKKYNSSHL